MDQVIDERLQLREIYVVPRVLIRQCALWVSDRRGHCPEHIESRACVFVCLCPLPGKALGIIITAELDNLSHERLGLDDPALDDVVLRVGVGFDHHRIDLVGAIYQRIDEEDTRDEEQDQGPDDNPWMSTLLGRWPESWASIL